MELAPVALFTYNRPDHTKRTIESLLNNELADKTDIFIFCDAAKKTEDKNKVDEVRSFLRTINGFKNIEIIERTANLGLAKSIISGVTDVINKFGKIIVLEDDMITSRYFLSYMNKALNIYDIETDVISIHGYVYPVKNRLPETFFLKGADCWGWATWKRGWDLFEADGKKLLRKLKERNFPIAVC
jgi:GT2 family glycosyltransferase